MDAIRARLFRDLQDDLATAGIGSLPAGSIPCPLCWEPKGLAELTIEHIVPSAVGGHVGTLTCRECNNADGARYDAHLANYQQFIDSFRSDAGARGHLIVGDDRVSVRTSWGPEGNHIHVRIAGQASDPKRVNAVLQSLASGAAEECTVTTFGNYIPRQFKLGLLRVAYLALFKRLGYGYTVTPTVQAIRRQIRQPEPDDRDIELSLVAGTKKFKAPVDRPFLIASGQLGHISCFIVMIRLRDRSCSHHLVFMPVPGHGDDHFLEAFATFARSKPTYKLSGVPPGGLF